MRRRKKRVVGKDQDKEIMIMNKYYLDFKKNKEMICVYSDETDTESFATGYVVGVSDDDIILYHLTPNGNYDGYLLLPINKVFLIEHDTKYSNKIKYISEKQSKQNIQYFDDENLKSCLIKYAFENDLIIEVQLINSGLNDVVGKVFSFDEETIIIDKYTEYGEKDGHAIFNILDITRLSCDNEEERIIKYII